MCFRVRRMRRSDVLTATSLTNRIGFTVSNHLLQVKHFPKTTLVAEDKSNDKLIGVLLGYDIPQTHRWKDKRRVYVTTLVVDPSYQNIGIGTALMNTIRFSKPKPNIIEMAINSESESFYKKLTTEWSCQATRSKMYIKNDLFRILLN